MALSRAREARLPFPVPVVTRARDVGSPTLPWSPQQRPRRRTQAWRARQSGRRGRALQRPRPQRVRGSRGGAVRGSSCGGGGDGGGRRAGLAGAARRLRCLCRYRSPSVRPPGPGPASASSLPLLGTPSSLRPTTPPGTSAPPRPRDRAPLGSPSPRTPAPPAPLPAARRPRPQGARPRSLPALHPRGLLSGPVPSLQDSAALGPHPPRAPGPLFPQPLRQGAPHGALNSTPFVRASLFSFPKDLACVRCVVAFCSELEVIPNAGAVEDGAPPGPDAAPLCSGWAPPGAAGDGFWGVRGAAPVQRGVQPRHTPTHRTPRPSP